MSHLENAINKGTIKITHTQILKTGPFYLNPFNEIPIVAPDSHNTAFMFRPIGHTNA